ncbi:hypothetical protein CCP3SC1_510022 [Gammaproteobacteria bacterium]
MSPISYQQIIDRLQNTGYAAFFHTVRNEMEMINKVGVINGAIGYLSDTNLRVG